ncbi:MAG: zf-HC2 domain-containing protein [Acidobacteriia bacterium]|nr:zf-HC2 domain-containing protein [Terriglobia bacterium]
MAVKDDAAEEKALGRIIAGKLREQLQSEPSGCPDVELLSAYFERALSPSERTVCETHLMTCPRCQLFVAELARLSEADERPVIVGEPEIVVKEETGWPFRLAWLAPVLVILIVAGVWYAEKIRNYNRPPEQTAMEEPTPAATPPAGEAAKSKDHKIAATPPLKPAEEGTQKAREEQKEQVATAVPPATAAGRAEGQQPTRSGITIKGEAPGTAPGAAVGGIAAPSERDRLAASAAETRVLQIPAGSRPAEATNRAMAAAPPSAAPETARKSGRETQALAKQATAAKPSALTDYTIQGYTPAYHAKWRVGRGGLIQQYDSDRGWIDVPSGTQVDLFDVTFSNASVGWIVGHEGTVLRTSDGGANWSKVSSPTSEDLARVSAIGNQKAQVISRSGRAFVTTDAGRSWKPVSE